MKISILPRDDEITLVALEGRLDTTAVEEMGPLFSEAAGKRQRPTIVDLSQVDFMASRGIGMLIASSKELKRHGCKLVLLAPQQLVDSSLRTTRIDLVMPIAYELDDAIGLARGTVASAPARRDTAAPHVTSQPLTAGSSTGGPAELKMTIKNETSELQRLNEEVAQFLRPHGVAPRSTYAVNLAIDELVTNVIRYAYVDDDPHTITLTLSIKNEQIIMRIVDDGRPFDPRTGPTLDLHADERQVGGLGLILVLDMVDLLKYERVKDENHVEVRIHCRDHIDEGVLSASAGESRSTI
jgi:anti-anti-sigma factor